MDDNKSGQKNYTVLFNFFVEQVEHPLADMKQNDALAAAAFRGDIKAVEKFTDKLPKVKFYSDFSLS